MPHRILLSAYACAPDQGTEPGFGWNWASHLAAQGCEVTVLTREQNRERIERELQLTNVLNVHFQYVGLPFPLAKLKAGTGPHYLLWQWWAYVKARALHRLRPFALSHHVSYGSVHGGSWLWRLGIPLIFGPAGGGQTAPRSMRTFFGERWRREWLRSAATRLLPLSPWHRLFARSTRLMLATNPETHRVMRLSGAHRVRDVLDSGLSAGLLRPEADVRATSGEMLRLLWVGRLMPRKALRLALDALQYVKLPFHLTVLGDGEQGAELEGWTEARGLTGRVTWRGRVPWQEVFAAYRQHDLFLFTSLRDSYGSQLLEALSQGLPIVCLDHQGARTFVPENASLKVRVSTPDQTARAMAAAIETFGALSPEDRLVYRRAALAYARTQTWERKAAAMIELYGEVAGP